MTTVKARKEFPICSCNRLGLSLNEHTGAGALEVPYTVLVGRERSPKVLLIAGVHGDEYEGVAALHSLLQELDPNQLKGTLTIVPVANPKAFEAGSRRSPVDLVDLNRSFPGNPEGTASERLAHRLFQEAVLGNEILLSLHGWSKEAVVVPYVEYPEGDSGAAKRSRRAALALRMEFVHPYKWPKGLLGDAALKHGIASVETEVGGMGAVTPEGQAACRELLYRFLRHVGMVEPFDTAASRSSINAKIVGHVDCVANHAGLFQSRVRPGEMVAEGIILGTINGLAGELREEVKAPRRGLVAILRTMASVQPGDRLVQLFYWDSI